MVRAYNQMGWNYRYIQAAASDVNGNITFFHNHDEAYNEWGISDHDLSTVTGKGEQGTPVVVPTIRLSNWLKDEIFDRELPKSESGLGRPRVVMKMDIESRCVSSVVLLLFDPHLFV